ncbi:hypothetical protein D3C87_1521970 [compost metagenome]
MEGFRRIFPRALPDRPRDIVVRQAGHLRPIDRLAQAEVARWVPPAMARRDDDLARDPGKNRAAGRVQLGLAAFDVLPLASHMFLLHVEAEMHHDALPFRSTLRMVTFP